MSYLEMTPSNLLNYLWLYSVLQVANLCGLSLMLGWASVMRYLSVISVSLSSSVPTHISVSKLSETHWFTKLELDGIVLWSVVSSLPGKVGISSHIPQE